VFTKAHFLLIFLFTFLGCIAQKNSMEKNIIVADSIKKNFKINPLGPSRAGFLSAIFPGMGQAYNKKYWKMPIVYGALGTGIYLYSSNNKLYNQFRDEYKSRLAGNPSTNLTQFSDNTLIVGQRVYRRNRDLSLLFCIGLYALNIVDANVDAHLKQFNVNDNLSLSPALITNPIDFKQNAGLSVNFRLDY
jgi:hypothetical protein